VCEIALEVLRPRLAVVAVPVHRLGPTPAPTTIPASATATAGHGESGDEPRDLVVGGRRVPGPDVERAHHALEARQLAASADRRPGPDAAAPAGERVLLDPAVDRDWWIITRLAPWADGMTGFDSAGRHLFDAARDERLLLLRLTPSELTVIRARITAAGGDPDVVTRPRSAGGQELRWWDVASRALVMSLVMTSVAPNRIADLRDDHAPLLATTVDLLLLAVLVLFAVVTLREVAGAARTGLRLRRRRTPPDGVLPTGRRRPARGPAR